ncbi:MAG TPA: glycosyltransferase [Kiritimatiellia bacterium]|nr:glycosyltransferase [Kiritimatiellia bacterium]
MKQAIHQFTAGYSNGDAISNDARAWRQVFRSWGYPSEIYCEARRTLPELRKDSRDIATAAQTIGANDIAILHLSIGSDVNLAFRDLKCRKVILYHNMTPPEYFRGYQEEIVASLKKGRDQLALLRDCANVNLAVSCFNARELSASGYSDVGVVPLLMDRSHWTGSVDQRIVQEYRDGFVNILFVGRCAPNKRIEDLIFTLYYSQNYANKNTRLIHVGSAAGLERYEALLRTKIRELKLDNIVMAGSVSPAALRGYYQAADVFLCLSEHEGFCIPLLEAMANRVPVLAYSAGAITETLDGAGVLIREKQYDVIAETIQKVATTPLLRDAIIEGQVDRLARFSARDVPAMMKTAISKLLD